MTSAAVIVAALLAGYVASRLRGPRHREWFIGPLPGEVPTYDHRAPTLSSRTARTELQAFYDRLVQMHRHEYNLFNARLGAFLVVTTLLLNGYANAKTPSLRLTTCTAGLGLSLLVLYLLSRTGGAIQWYTLALFRLEEALYPEDLRPYLTRRGQKSKPPPVSFFLGVVVPLAAVLFWSALLIVTSSHPLLIGDPP